MLNLIWLALVLIAVFVGGFTGRLEAMTEGAFASAKDAVMSIALLLVGLMAIWLGMMRLAERTGFVQLLARALRPVMRRLFPDVPVEHPAMGAMVMNMSANMLGLGNATTPLGLRAMALLQKDEPLSDRCEQRDGDFSRREHCEPPTHPDHRDQHPRRAGRKKSVEHRRARDPRHGIRKTRHAVAVGLTADIIATACAIASCRFLLCNAGKDCHFADIVLAKLARCAPISVERKAQKPVTFPYVMNFPATICTVIFAASALGAPLPPPPAQLDLEKLPSQAKVINHVVVPVPNEVFAALDRLGKPRWAGLIHRDVSKAKPSGEAPQIAMMLGVIIAEGLIAVEAEDSEEVKELGRAILTFSDAIGVRKAVVRRANSVIEFADKKSWNRVRTELDGALTDVREAMIELNSEPLAQLVSLGGWLRGTDVLAQVVSMDFSARGAELLHQPGLVEHFEKQVDGMKSRLRSNRVVGKVRQGLNEIQPLLGDSGKISVKSLTEIAAIAGRLVTLIRSK